MKKTLRSIVHFLKKETVLCVSLILAVLSSFLVTPDKQYADYIDVRTLLLLFCLMAVMAGFQKLGLFALLGNRLLSLVKTVRQMITVLVFLPFFTGMLITNDVALITFVPFGIIVLKLAKKEQLLIPLVLLQSVAANMGSMLTPIGNPQNLYLYSKAGLSLPAFMAIMLPYTLTAGLLILIGVLIVTRSYSGTELTLFSADNAREAASGQEQARTRTSAQPQTEAAPPFFSDPGSSRADAPLDIPRTLTYGAAFVLCLLTVANILPVYALTAVIIILFLISDFKVFAQIDYALLGTFVGFFIFVGNMGRLTAFRDFLSGILDGNELLVTALSSQVISNVPAALLLSGFTDNYRALIIGTNLGGLGTLIASMASLISYKLLARECPNGKTRYLLWFTLVNVVMLILLTAAGALFAAFA